MGIYVIEAEVLAACLRDGALDFGRDVLPRCAGRAGIFAHRFRDPVRAQSSYWRDVGTIDAYWQVHMELLSADAPFDTRDPRWPIGELRAVGPHAPLVPMPPQTAAESKIARAAQVHRLRRNDGQEATSLVALAQGVSRFAAPDPALRHPGGVGAPASRA